MGKFSMTYLDHDDERSNVSVGIVDLDVNNITAQLALIATLQAAIEAIVIGSLDPIPVVACATALCSRWLPSILVPARPSRPTGGSAAR